MTVLQPFSLAVKKIQERGCGWRAGESKKAVQKATKSQRASRYAIAREAQHDAWPAREQAGADRRCQNETSTDGRRPCGRASALPTTCSRLAFRATRFSHALRRRSANGSQRWERMLQQGERRTPRVRRPHRDWRLQQSSSGMRISMLALPARHSEAECCKAREAWWWHGWCAPDSRLRNGKGAG